MTHDPSVRHHSLLAAPVRLFGTRNSVVISAPKPVIFFYARSEKQIHSVCQEFFFLRNVKTRELTSRMNVSSYLRVIVLAAVPLCLAQCALYENPHHLVIARPIANAIAPKPSATRVVRVYSLAPCTPCAVLLRDLRAAGWTLTFRRVREQPPGVEQFPLVIYRRGGLSWEDNGERARTLPPQRVEVIEWLGK
jgi:hypothetical protein